MGICIKNGKPIEVPDEKTCKEKGGVVYPPSEGICFIRNMLTPALGRAIFHLGNTWKTGKDFRDQILLSSERGRQLVNNYQSL